MKTIYWQILKNISPLQEPIMSMGIGGVIKLISFSNYCLTFIQVIIFLNSYRENDLKCIKYRILHVEIRM